MKSTPEKKIYKDVSETGWHVVMVPEDDEGPGFAYTIGLFKSHGHPELISFGLPPPTLQSILNNAGELVKKGKKFAAGKASPGIIKNFTCGFTEFPEKLRADFLGYAVWFYKEEMFPVLQLSWPDKAGLFPWDKGVASPVKELQTVKKRRGWRELR